MLYLHGGGYIGTSPRMYALFTAWLCRQTGCEMFVADLRLAPEFPFPAGLEDAVLVLEALLTGGGRSRRLFVAGDSSGGGLASSLVYSMIRTRHRPIAGVILFSPELDLLLDEPSVADNAARDILPWNIPTSSYLHGRSAGDGSVSAIDQDVSGWPPTFVSFGGDEMFRDAIRVFVAHLDVVRCGHGRPRGAGNVPRLPDSHAVGRGQPPDLSRPSANSWPPTCPWRGRCGPDRAPARPERPADRPGPRRRKAVTLSVSHFGICVADLERSLRFYCEGLGFEPVASHHVGAEFAALMEVDQVDVESRMVRRDGVTIELLDFVSPGVTGDGGRRPMNQLGLTHLSLRVDDVDQVATTIEGCGGTVVRATRTTLDLAGSPARLPLLHRSRRGAHRADGSAPLTGPGPVLRYRDAVTPDPTAVDEIDPEDGPAAGRRRGLPPRCA